MPLRSPFDRDIAKLAIPALGTLVAEPLYVLADTAFVGHLGTDQLAGLALATTILLTLHAMLIFLAYGTTGPVARLLSAGRTSEAAHRSTQAMWLGAILGLGASVLLALAGPLLLRAMSSDSTVLAFAETYLRISLIGFPFLVVTMAANGCFHGRQNTRTPLVLAIVGAVANLAIEFLLITILGYGVGASALSTIIVQIVIGVVAVWLVAGWSLRSGATIRPDGAAMAALLRSGKALLARSILLRGSFSVATIVAASMGIIEVAAHQVVIGVWATLALALDAVAIAGQALTGKWLGAGDKEQARAATRRMIEVDVAVGVAMGLAVLLLRNPIAELFTSDPAVSTMAAFLLVHLAVQQPLNGIVFALDGILIGASDFTYLARSMALAAAVFAILVAVVIMGDLGIGWLWIAIAGLMLARLGPLVHRWQRDQWLVVGAE